MHLEDENMKSAMEKEVEQRFDSYIKTVIHNAKTNYKKHESRGWQNKTMFLEDIPEYGYLCDNFDAEIFKIGNYEFEVTNTDLAEVLNSMAVDLRNVAILAFMGGFSDDEIALILNMKRRTVNEHRHRALKILRECLK